MRTGIIGEQQLIFSFLSALPSHVLEATREMDAVFGAALRKEVASWPNALRGAAEIAAGKRRLLYHGISGLLHERRDDIADWPAELLDLIRDETLARTMWEMRHRLLIADVVQAMKAQEIGCSVLKGTALAYSFYPNPALRFRGDTDLLIRERDLARTRQVLSEKGWGYSDPSQTRVVDVRYQEGWCFYDNASLTHQIDLHWEVTNSRALQSVLNVEQLLADAAPLPTLSADAQCADPVTALLHGCINRAMHAQSGYEFLGGNEFDPDRLIWAYDFNLLSATFSDAQWTEFTRRCIDVGVAPICKDALLFARSSYQMHIPQPVLSALEAAPQGSKALRYINSRSALERSWADFQATPGIRRKLVFLLGRLFPSPDYLRNHYPDLEHWPTPLLYLRRAISICLRLDRRRDV